MAVPKKKTSKSRRNNRRSHHALELINIGFDKRTGEPKLGHCVSMRDGYYNGKPIFTPRALKKKLASE